MKARIRIVCIFLTLSRLSLSLPIPETEPSYKSGPNGRGTIELLWSCLLTFGLCFWTVVHPNVIPWTGTWDQIKYRMGVMIGIIVIPEMLIIFALGQFLQAKKVLRSWESCFDGNEDVKKWLGKPGAFFVVMGGFVVDVRPPERHTIKELRTDPHLWHGRESSEQSELIDELLDTGLVKTICPKGFRELLRKDWFQDLIENHTLPKADFCQKRIKDRGKADSIAKFLVTVQILWMCIQCLGRELSGLPITLLEGHILIQILFSAVAYGLWWHKPLDVAQPISLSLPLDKVLPLISPKKYFYHQPHFITEYVECGGFFHLFSRVVYDVANYHTHQLEAYAIFMGLVNGGLHAVAWTSHFPTATEHLLWQISCIGTGILLPMAFAVMWIGGSEPYIVRACLNMTTQRQNGGFGALAAELWRARGDWYNGEPICKDNGSSIVPGPDCLPRWARISLPTLFGIFMFAYLFSILYLTIESFLSIRSLSKGAYATVEWSDFIPHI